MEGIQKGAPQINWGISRDNKNKVDKAKGRTFQMTREKVNKKPNVLSDIFTLNLLPIRVLFDLDAYFFPLSWLHLLLG